VDLGAILRLNKPCVRVGYEVEERTHPAIADLLAQFTARHEHRLEAARTTV